MLRIAFLSILLLLLCKHASAQGEDRAAAMETGLQVAQCHARNFMPSFKFEVLKIYYYCALGSHTRHSLLLALAAAAALISESACVLQ
jgi:hypothetical protein